jgi:hypothetical protein
MPENKVRSQSLPRVRNDDDKLEIHACVFRYILKPIEGFLKENSETLEKIK